VAPLTSTRQALEQKQAGFLLKCPIAPHLHMGRYRNGVAVNFNLPSCVDNGQHFGDGDALEGDSDHFPYTP
jgi:hypothetical protein